MKAVNPCRVPGDSRIAVRLVIRCISLIAAVSTITWSGGVLGQQPQRGTFEYVSWAILQIHSLQLTRDMCKSLYPAESSGILAHYEASDVPE
jgi:hypothetical protein